MARLSAAEPADAEADAGNICFMPILSAPARHRIINGELYGKMQ